MGFAKFGLLARVKTRVVNHYREIYERDRVWMMQFDTATLQKFLLPLFVGFVCLTFLDVYTTTLAFNFGPIFHEENPLAAALFDWHFQGYLLALLFKYLPMVPLFYIVFLNDRSGRHGLQVRIVKLSALVALVGADIFLLYVVGVNNLHAILFAP